MAEKEGNVEGENSHSGGMLLKKNQHEGEGGEGNSGGYSGRFARNAHKHE